MSRNGSGSYSLPSGNPVVPSTVISSTWANNTLSDIATALTQSIANDGQTVPVANLPMAAFRHTNVANAQSRNEYAAAGQVQDSSLQWLTSISGADTITASLTPSPATYVAGQVFRFVTAGTNTTTAPTLNVNGLGAKTITKRGTLPLAIGEMVSGQIVEVADDGTRFQLLGAVPSGALIGLSVFTASGTYTPTPGTNSIVLIMQGPGGGGGGVAANAAGNNSVGGGGGSGAWLIKRQTSGFNGATYVLPAGGAGGAAGNNAGATGGNATWSNGSLLAAGGLGGAGGSSTNVNAYTAYGNGGAQPSTGDANFPGNPGQVGAIINVANTQITGGQGANSNYGRTGPPPLNGTAPGGNAVGYGAGGSGAASVASGAAQAGGNGAGSIIIVYEYA